MRPPVMRVQLAAPLVLALIGALQPSSSPRQVGCTSSSYIDDYFLPTAKLALNKIQQSFAPAAGQAGSPTGNQTAAELAQIIGQHQQQQQATNPLPAPSTTTTTTTTEVVSMQATQADNNNNNNNNNDQQASKQDDQPPDKSEYINLNVVRPPPVPESQEPDAGQQQQQRDRDQDEGSPQVSPAGGGGGGAESPGQLAELADVAQSSEAELGRPAGSPSTAAVATTTATSTSTQAVAVDSLQEGGNSIDQLRANQQTPAEPAAPGSLGEVAGGVRSADEASVRETELEAVAAVDASIAFGDLLSSLSLADTCYDELGNARYCEPEFENVALERPVEASSECGYPPTRFCTTTYSPASGERSAAEHEIRNCHICDSQHEKKRHPAAYLTDANNQNAPTCWVSAPISASSGPASAAAKGDNGTATGPIGDKGAGHQPQQHLEVQRDNVTLTLRLGKSYDITYVSMQFCSSKPDSLVIYKSQNHGLTWTPYQYYSSQCNRMYGLEASGQSAVGNTRQQQQLSQRRRQPFEPVCVNSSQLGGQNSGRIAFLTLEGQQQQQQQPSPSEQSQRLSDWISATDIKIVLDRHQPSWIQSSLAYSHHLHNNNNNNNIQNAAAGQSGAAATGHKSPPVQATSAANETTATATSSRQLALESSLINPSDTYNYAISDLVVGGRCRCNGHASGCVHGKDGKLQCDCRHNTAGRDCERCAPFHFDRPWQPANQLEANPCQPCQCNGHSRKCHFDWELYKLSGNQSGGVCIGCRDNTAGRHCHYCREGYTRDHTRPMSDKEACKPCNCHEVGSLGRVCNQTTGQCPCKEGVTGLECNRCAQGYQQSTSKWEPCIKIPENDINYEPTIEASAGAGAADDELNPQPQLQQTDRNTNEPPANQWQPPPLVDQSSLQQPHHRARNQINHFGDQVQARQHQHHHSNRANGQHHSQQGRPLLMMGRPDAGYYQRPAGGKRFHQHQQQRPKGSAVYLSETADSSSPMDQDQDRDQEGASLNELANNDYPPYQQDYPTPNRPFSYQRFSTRHQQQQHHRGRPSPNKQPAGGGGGLLVASLDEPADAGLQLVGGSLQADDGNGGLDQLADPMLEFSNHIQPSQVGPLARGRHNHHNRQQHPMRPTLPGAASASVGETSGNNYYQQQQQQQDNLMGPMMQNSITCADCQSAIRKFTRRQFCQQDYAIKAQVLNKFTAEDWTQFEVEIKDIFKSPRGPNSAGQLADSLLSGNGLSAVVQNDDPSGGLQLAASNETRRDQEAAGSEVSPSSSSSSNRRLKIGNIESIWVPTEDVSCKCPRLRQGAVYLLLGLVDLRLNSVTSLQLDRHGVALEWRPSLQDRLLKFQRRQSRKGCQ